MPTFSFQNKPLLVYLLKFGGYFCLLYFGTLAVIGLSTPENAYSPLVANYLNFIDPLRASILLGAKAFLALFGYPTVIENKYTLMMGSSGVRMVYSCIGYGVMSFWAAFVMANKASFGTKAIWVAGGLLLLWAINILRIGLLLLALSKNWSIPWWDHHTWFNLAAYAAIFTMIYFFDKSTHFLKPTAATSHSISRGQ